jgi:hypothetical protein
MKGAERFMAKHCRAARSEHQLRPRESE